MAVNRSYEDDDWDGLEDEDNNPAEHVGACDKSNARRLIEDRRAMRELREIYGLSDDELRKMGF